MTGWKRCGARSKITGRPLAAAALNAGIGIGGAFIDTALEDELRMIAVNATSQVHLAKRIVPGMVAARSGLSCSPGRYPLHHPDAIWNHVRSHAGVCVLFAQSLREELLGTGVTGMAPPPGATDSEFHQRAGMATRSSGTIAGRTAGCWSLRRAMKR